jgi:O-antigen/teichoic acid export membrane protein
VELPETVSASGLVSSAIARLRTEAGWQTSLLYGAQLASMVLNFAFTVVIGRAMSQDDFGVFSFCVFSVVMFLGYLFEFGIFSAGARLLALAETPEDERRTLGALLLAGAGVGALFSLTIAVSGPLVDFGLARSGHGDTRVAGILLAIAPLAAAVPLQQLVEQACQGTNKIGALAALRLALPLSSISIIAAAHFIFGPISPAAAATAYLGGIFAAVVVVAIILRPSFAVRREDFTALRQAVREFGLNIYLSRVVSMMSTRLDQIVIPVFVGPKRFGAYKIAQQVSEPVSGLARAMATTRFKAFASRTEVSRYIERWNIALLSAASLGLASVGPWVLVIAFPGKFKNALQLLFPFALVALFAGLLQPYNVFLTARGEGRALRNIALAMGAANLVGLLVFVRRYGLLGAAWFAVASMAFNFVLHLYYYRKLHKELNK